MGAPAVTWIGVPLDPESPLFPLPSLPPVGVIITDGVVAVLSGETGVVVKLPLPVVVPIYHQLPFSKVVKRRENGMTLPLKEELGIIVVEL
jgi:hypothetical protein